MHFLLSLLFSNTKTGTEQTHHEAEHICHLVACIDKDSGNIRFLVLWVIVDVEEKWFLGYLFLRDVGTEGDKIGFTRYDITSQVNGVKSGKNIKKVLKETTDIALFGWILGYLLGIGFNKSRYTWTEGSVTDSNFEALQEMLSKEKWCWRAEGTKKNVTLTKK